MKLIDAHHHLWEPQALPYVWLRQLGKYKPFGDPTAIRRNYLPKNYLDDVGEANIVELISTVHVQADGALPDPVAETFWLEDLKSTIPSAIVGFADLGSADLHKVLKRHAQSPRFRGVRQIIGKLADRPDLSFTSEDLLEKSTWQKGFSLLQEFNVSFDQQLYPYKWKVLLIFWEIIRKQRLFWIMPVFPMTKLIMVLNFGEQGWNSFLNCRTCMSNFQASGCSTVIGMLKIQKEFFKNYIRLLGQSA